jgi:hypothetical protein
MKNKFSIAITLAVLMAMLVTSLALADVVTSDVDFVATGDQTLINLGTVAPSQVVNTSTSFQLVCSGKNHADQGNTVFVNYFSATVPAGSLTAGNTTIGPIPGSWADDSGDCISPAPIFNDNGNSAVTITAPAAAGTYDYVVTYKVCQSNDATQCGGIDPNDVSGSVPPVTFRLTVTGDTTAPLITKVITGTAGTNGWYTSNVTVAWTVTDPDSAVVIDSGCGTQNFTSDTSSVTSSCTAHSTGGTASDSVNLKIDKTAPTGVSGAPNRAADSGTWYNHAVDVVFTGSDATSGIASCTTTNYSGPDGSGVTVNGSCSDNAGNSSASVASSAFNYDGTAPTAALSVTAGTAGANGWYTSDVTVSTTGSDALSGVTCTANQFQTTETAGAVFNGSCTNGAGLTTNAAPLTVKLDKTGPSASLAVTAGTLGAHGWYTSDVTVSTSGSDDVSGPVICTDDQFQTDETTGAEFNGACTNNAGLTTNAVPLTVKLDKTGPSAALAVTAGTLGNNGWYVTNVTISTTGSDGISSPVLCTADQYQTSDTTGQLFNGSCTNDAGLTTNATSLTIKRDATAPALAPTVSPNPVILNAPATATPNATDATSGVASSGCGAVNTSAAGTFTVGCSATDNAGNSATGSASYTVSYKVCALYDQTKAHKSGSTVPVKLQLCDVNGVNYSSSSIVVKAVSVSKLDNSASGVLDDSGSANSPDMNFRYDATLNGYIFNLSTKGFTTGTWKVTFTVNNAGSYFVQFDVK